MKTRDLAATCKLYRLVLSQGGRHVASQRPTFTLLAKRPLREITSGDPPYATPTRQRPLSKTAAAAWGLCAHGIVEHALSLASPRSWSIVEMRSPK